MRQVCKLRCIIYIRQDQPATLPIADCTILLCAALSYISWDAPISHALHHPIMGYIPSFMGCTITLWASHPVHGMHHSNMGWPILSWTIPSLHRLSYPYTGCPILQKGCTMHKRAALSLEGLQRALLRFCFTGSEDIHAAARHYTP